jgi:hypothetical protein
VGAALWVGLRVGCGERVGGSGVAVASRDSEAEAVGDEERDGGVEREGEPEAEAVDLPQPAAPITGAPSGGDSVGALVLLLLPQIEGEAVDEVEREGGAEAEGEPEADTVDSPLGEGVSREDRVPLAEGRGEKETRGECEGEEEMEGEGVGENVTAPLPEAVGLLLWLALLLADAGTVEEARGVALCRALGEAIAVNVGSAEAVQKGVTDGECEAEAHCDTEGEPEAVREDCQRDAEGAPEMEAPPLGEEKEDGVAPLLRDVIAEGADGSAEGVPPKWEGDEEDDVAPVALAGAGVLVPFAPLPLARGVALSVAAGDCVAVAAVDKEGEVEDEGQGAPLREGSGESEEAGEGVEEKEGSGEREEAGVPVGGATVGDVVSEGANRVADGATPVPDGAPENESAPVAVAAEAVGALDALVELDPPPSKIDVGVAPPGKE